MPKAASTRHSSSPTKSSPQKPSYRKNISGDFSVPLGASRSSLPSGSRAGPSGHASSRSRDTSHSTATNGKRIQLFENVRIGTSHTKDKPIWLADDIFTTPKTSRVVTTEPKFEFQPPQEDGKAEDEFPRMLDMEEALDEATIHKGLVGRFLTCRDAR